MSRLEVLEWIIIILLINDVSPKLATRKRLKFAFSRASWTDDLAAGAIAKRERRLETMLKHALQSSPLNTYRLRQSLFEWDAKCDTFAHGKGAPEFLRKATAALGAKSPDDFPHLKRWAIAEFNRIDDANLRSLNQ